MCISRLYLYIVSIITIIMHIHTVTLTQFKLRRCTCNMYTFIKTYNLVLNLSCFLIINPPPRCISITTIHTSWHYLTRCYSSNLKTTIEKRLTFDNAMSFTAWQIIPRNKVLVGLLQKLCEVDESCFLVV